METLRGKKDNDDGNSIGVTTVRTARPSAFGTSTTNGSYVMLVKKSTGAIGATKLLKVMSGDVLNVSVDYYYAANADNTGAGGYNTFLNSLINILTNSETATGIVKGNGSTIKTNQSSDGNVTSFFTSENGGTTNSTPKAYLHVLFFDERFVFDNTNSYVQQVGVGYTLGTRGTITLAQKAVKKNGYAYIYYSNETEGLVYFDNFMLTHIRGPLLEDNAYSVWGLVMQGIPSKALNFGGAENKRGFNGGNELQNKEFSDGSGLELYDAVHRMYDPQIGRFGQPDKLGDLSHDISLYAFASNNPICRNDPLGLTDDDVTKKKGKPGFSKDNPNILPEVIVRSSNHRYQTFVWYGWSSTIDTHWKGNLNQFTYRMRDGSDIIQKGDRYSYIDDILNGKLPEQFNRDEKAREFEQDFYNVYFGLATLPEDIVGVVGIVKGVKSLPSIGKLIKGLLVNKSGIAILKDGYYEVNGLKFSKYYYEKLWSTGRKAPPLIAKEILEAPRVSIVRDISKGAEGFYRIETSKWEIVYNPLTKEVWHMQPIK